MKWGGIKKCERKKGGGEENLGKASPFKVERMNHFSYFLVLAFLHTPFHDTWYLFTYNTYILDKVSNER